MQAIYCKTCGYQCEPPAEDLNGDPTVYCACGEILGSAFSIRAFVAGEADTPVNVRTG
jgi:hypothetical protein